MNQYMQSSDLHWTAENWELQGGNSGGGSSIVVTSTSDIAASVSSRHCSFNLHQGGHRSSEWDHWENCQQLAAQGMSSADSVQDAGERAKVAQLVPGFFKPVLQSASAVGNFHHNFHVSHGLFQQSQQHFMLGKGMSTLDFRGLGGHTEAEVGTPEIAQQSVFPQGISGSPGTLSFSNTNGSFLPVTGHDPALFEQRRRLYGLLEMDPMKREEFYAAAEASARIGLNLGVRTYFSSEDTLGRLGKRPRANSPGAQVPLCQAEGCKADLSGAKHYHRRHKVCELHSKAATVTANGQTQRFCQQCSRFHPLGEFDEGKRSCRKRLADHNRRRRKPQPVLSAAAPKEEEATANEKLPTSPTSSQEHSDTKTAGSGDSQHLRSPSAPAKPEDASGAHSALLSDRPPDTQALLAGLSPSLPTPETPPPPPYYEHLTLSSAAAAAASGGQQQSSASVVEYHHQVSSSSGGTSISSWLKPPEVVKNSGIASLAGIVTTSASTTGVASSSCSSRPSASSGHGHSQWTAFSPATAAGSGADGAAGAAGSRGQQQQSYDSLLTPGRGSSDGQHQIYGLTSSNTFASQPAHATGVIDHVRGGRLLQG